MNSARAQLFIRWWIHQLRTYDCDSSIFAMKYIIDRMELNVEQRFWFCWIYANTYHLPTAWVIFNEFPDYANTPQDRIANWSHENRARLPYQKDQKWLRGNLGDTFASYKANLGVLAQSEYFETFTREADRAVNFSLLWQTILDRFNRFGRYTAWFYLQTLKEVCGLALEPTSLMLSFDSSATHRAGLCLALGRDELAAKGTKFNASALAQLDFEAKIIHDEVVQGFPELQQLPVKADYFSMETSLCSFKKLFRRTQGRYLGYYLDRFAEDITKTASCDWPGINWQLLWDARNECLLPQLNNRTVNKDNFHLFLDHGTFHPDLQLNQQLDEWIYNRK